uniref:NADH dehydrogenase subunit 3 n=1 Tax=Cyphoderus aff. similis TaxID=2901280 RepID=UPI001EE120BD|nr:NADH dehydrogenase subunit 3 [Cyphoderus aff. similis]UIR97918.1 NADH dehydrogenase subunit 3 [Cyphoderus aff. similis]
MLLVFLISLGLSCILIVINSFISKKIQANREKNSPFECGFDPKNMARIPFSLRFYLIAVIFLIFDVEITLIMPVPILMNQNNLYSIMLLSTFFISILILGLLHEWNEGALQWDM